MPLVSINPATGQTLHRFIEHSRGEVDRMVVVYKMDKPPVFARPSIFRSAANTR